MLPAFSGGFQTVEHDLDQGKSRTIAVLTPPTPRLLLDFGSKQTQSDVCANVSRVSVGYRLTARRNSVDGMYLRVKFLPPIYSLFVCN